MGCLGWMLILGGIGSFFLSLGLAAPLAFGLMALGLLFVIAGSTGKSRRASRSIAGEVAGLRKEIRRLRKARGK